MSYPGAKVHRVSRRKLGRGQVPSVPTFTVALSVATTTLTLTFSSPAVVTGVIPVTVAGGPTFVSQTVVNQTTVTQTWSATLVGHTVTVPPAAANVTSSTGAKVAGISASF